MTSYDASVNPARDAQALAPANCNHKTSINLRLEDTGLTPQLAAGAFELISCMSCYGLTRRDRSDLRAAAALIGDVLNRMRSATPSAVAHG